MDQVVNPVEREVRLPTRLIRGGQYGGTDFRGRDFIGVDVEGAKFDNCNFEGVSLVGANLNHCSFRGANLTRACLRDAMLYGLDICGTVGMMGGMTRTDGHIFYAVMGWPDLMIKAGCRWFDIETARDHWRNHEESRAIVGCLEVMARAKGWRPLYNPKYNVD